MCSLSIVLLIVKNVTGKATSVSEALQSHPQPSITSVLPAPHSTAKVIFDNHQTADFKYIWV